jgi:hypothetical protein
MSDTERWLDNQVEPSTLTYTFKDTKARIQF